MWGLNIWHKLVFACKPERHASPGVEDGRWPYARREAASCLAAGRPARRPGISAPGHCLSFASSPGPPGAWGRKGPGPLRRWEAPELSVSGKRMFKRLAWVSVSPSRLPPGAAPAPPLSTGRLSAWLVPAPSHWPSYSMCYIGTSCPLFLSNILY